MLDGIAGSPFDGRELACVDASLFCAACNTQRVIVSLAGERTMSVIGTRVASQRASAIPA